MKRTSGNAGVVRTGILAIAIALLYTACSPSQPQLAALPTDPCKVLSAGQVSLITGLEVSEPFRAPSLEKVIRAQELHTEPEPGTICVYNTSSQFGAISLSVPKQDERTAARYWDSRSSYFERFPGSAEGIADLGQDAWIDGGTQLHVLTPNGEFFSVSTQMYQARSRNLLIKLGRAVLESLSRP